MSKNKQKRIFKKSFKPSTKDSQSNIKRLTKVIIATMGKFKKNLDKKKKKPIDIIRLSNERIDYYDVTTQYVKWYNREINQIFNDIQCVTPRLHSSNVHINSLYRYQTRDDVDEENEGEVLEIGSLWTSIEKRKFFRLLSRYSIHRFDDWYPLFNGTKSKQEILTYYEVLKNISVTTWLHNINEQSDLKIISKITRLCGVDINLEKNEIAAFGWKRIQLAKRLLLWSNYNDMENDLNSTSFKQTIDKIETETTKETWFPFTEIQNLNWLKRIEPLEYLHKVSPIEVSSSTISPQANILDILSSKDKADSMYDFFTTQSSTSTETTSSNVLSISLGQILKTKQPPVNTTTKKHKSISNWVFQSRVPQLSQKLMKLPLYNEINEEDELLSLDQHDYYLQLMFTPSSQSPNKETPTSAFSRNQPLELWLQLDENEQIVMDSVQAIIPTLRENYLIQTPDLPCDYKISNDHVINIPVTLESQPQLISYLNNIHTGNNIDNFKIPSELTMNNPSQNADSIKYDYVTCNRHKVLKLKYMDKYYVQYSEIDGGELGEKSQQIDFIANESNPTKEEFKQFVTDIFKF